MTIPATRAWIRFGRYFRSRDTGLMNRPEQIAIHGWGNEKPFKARGSGSWSFSTVAPTRKSRRATTQPNWALLMPSKWSHRHAARGFQRKQSYFSTKRKAGDSCRNNGNTAGFRAGVYCSGIGSKEGSGASVITAEDIRNNASGRKLSYWVTNDACPPSPGCVIPKRVPLPTESGVHFASVWQFAQSPRRNDFASGCSNYNRDGNCYTPGLEGSHMHVDVDVADSPDPSAGRTGK